MTAPVAAAATLAVTAVFAAVADERARAYGLPLCVVSPGSLSTIAAAACIAAALASRNVATLSIVVVIAAAAVCSLTDAQTGYIFDRVLAIGAVFGVAAAWADHRVVAAVAGSLALGLVFSLLRAVAGAGAMGLGDLKLAALLGLGLGAPSALHAACYAFIAGGAFGVALLALRRAGSRSPVPFAPFLSIGIVLACFGTDLT